MSKIYDALHKASQGEPDDGLPPKPVVQAAPAPMQPDVPQFPEGMPRSEPILGHESPFIDELDRLRASLDRILPQELPQSLMVVGAVPGEGASTVATSFAHLLAEDPRFRVLYVDADLRNRDERLIPPVDPGEGFGSLLETRASMGDLLRPTTIDRLDVLPSEGLHASPYRSTSGERVGQIINEAKAGYNRILIDAAPILVAPETAVMANEVDGVILVIRSGREKREVILEAVDALKKHNAHILGVVMNRQKYVVPGFIYRRL